jgi:serine/threonine protein kinase
MSVIPEHLEAGLADRYRIEREFGRGGMATVYLARDLKHDRPVGSRCSGPSSPPELRRLEDGLDALSIDVIGAVARDRIGHEIRRELDHPGPSVVASLFIEVDGEPVGRLEYHETHGACAEDVYSDRGRQGLGVGKPVCGGIRVLGCAADCHRPGMYRAVPIGEWIL